ncbi:hypothetical protein SOV_35530 [Sporomusa ovata DSM 2662]|uniref:Toxin SymE-like domain-containing protein n=1 Tax=Sporomusa ovata TaxID=2378 RepID=A0A0U1L6Q2_9FIRM|nr:SymE family type I addiction module toxin [Sporomusa ovata]EQB24599.1 toxin SymE, type I toxin-antitoxin system [Sporomusa ovata DSM 2662]EQB24703.1 toxin SymE, type I toxin-antitoxin system [Sporomusa ovata DSM 2662]CQR74959.1 hypothetical protein SpAn4DRAFT_4316 [Sporomusa ovata]CQR75050.1 hypothetical protein SpAn4DRAFT_4414 [Sporomusa ovata]
MSKRILKIYQSVAYSKPDVPCIMLQGYWLRELGFRIGNYILVEEGQGKLIIQLVEKGIDSE